MIQWNFIDIFLSVSVGIFLYCSLVSTRTIWLKTNRPRCLKKKSTGLCLLPVSIDFTFAGLVAASATTEQEIFFLGGPAGKIISMTNSAHGENVGGRQCQTSTD